MKKSNGKLVVLAIFAIVLVVSLIALAIQKFYLNPRPAPSPVPASEASP